MYSYYVPRYAAKKAQMKPVQLATVLGSEVMWAVAAYADRVNGGVYIKNEVRNEQGVVTQTRNRDVIREEVQRGLVNVTKDDFELGREARAWQRDRIMLKILKGQTISDFERSLQDVVQQEEFSNRTDALAIAIVASQIASYRKGQAAEEIIASVDRSPLAAVGTKVAVDAVVVRSVYSQKYNVHFVTARTQCNRLVFFSYREGLDADTPIRVRGTVKAHRPDSTQLNRVKLV